MPFGRCLLIGFACCLLWVLLLAGAGYIFKSAIYNDIGGLAELSYMLFVVVVAVIVLGIGGFYVAEKYWLSRKIEHADPEASQKLEHAAEEKLHEIKEEIQDLIPHSLARHKDAPKQKNKENKAVIS